jgi:hypothetical protein
MIARDQIQRVPIPDRAREAFRTSDMPGPVETSDTVITVSWDCSGTSQRSVDMSSCRASTRRCSTLIAGLAEVPYHPVIPALTEKSRVGIDNRAFVRARRRKRFHVPCGLIRMRAHVRCACRCSARTGDPRGFVAGQGGDIYLGEILIRPFAWAGTRGVCTAHLGRRIRCRESSGTRPRGRGVLDASKPAALDASGVRRAPPSVQRHGQVLDPAR